MKKIVLISAMMVLSQMVVLADEQKVNYENPYYNKPSVSQRKPDTYAQKNSQVYKPGKGNDYILKYNIDDLESAPWLNGGKRKI